MTNNNLKLTKIRLSIIFAWLVFFIAFFLELFYFSFRYLNFSYFEKQEFESLTNNFVLSINKDSLFLENFLKEKNRFKPSNWRFNNEKQWPWPWWFKFISFVLTNKNWEIIVDWINERFNLNIDLKDIKNSNLILNNWVLIKKIDISNNDYWNIYFFKKQIYSFEDYIEDLLMFSIIDIIFSIIFYLIWYIFVNKNLKPVEEIIADMSDFIHNASHELKTPISVISSNLQLIKATKNYDEELVLDSVWEIKRIDWLINWLVELSNIKSTQLKEDIHIENEVKDIINELKSSIEKNNLTLNLEVKKDFVLNTNKQYFYILVSNLLRNAIKYNIENWKINILIDKNKLVISNTWYGIDSWDIDKIFYRFYKTEKSRSTEWFWIWLSLVKKICDIYNWEIVVKSEINKITTFEIHF